jgi:hypothetical protein
LKHLASENLLINVSAKTEEENIEIAKRTSLGNTSEYVFTEFIKAG